MNRATWCRGAALLGAVALFLMARLASTAEPATGTAPLDLGRARVVLVGDSITGLSRNYATGFAHQMEWALKAVDPQCKPELIALGGSGAGVGAWLNFEKRSRGEEFFLDVKGNPVKATLDQPADVLVVMLGMNDVLAPYVLDTPASLDQWTENYRNLISALRERLHPRVVGLATVTMNTEDPSSPKNVMIGKLNERVTRLAAELDCRLLPTGAAVQDALRQGRQLRPDFHVTYDFVHPNEAGHLAVATAMLRGLGAEQAAERLVDVRLAALLRKTAGEGPTLSYAVTPAQAGLASDRSNFRLQYWWTPRSGQSGEQLEVSLHGANWEVTPSISNDAQGEFLVTGSPDRLTNILSLEVNDTETIVKQAVTIRPPWLVTAGIVQPYWTNLKFDPAKSATPLDDMIRRSGDFMKTATTASGQQFRWTRYYPSVDYTGLNAPGSVDFSAVVHAQNFESGYAARWIKSERERPVTLVLGTQAFAGNLYLSVFLNGNEIYRGQLTDEPRKKKQIETRLRAGWNALVINANHCTWQWQFSADVLPAGDESLDDLRYSVVPHP